MPRGTTRSSSNPASQPNATSISSWNVEHPDYASKKGLGDALSTIRKREKAGEPLFFSKIELSPTKTAEPTSRAANKTAAKDLRKTADDQRADRADRVAAVFSLFANNLKLPCESCHCRQGLRRGGLADRHQHRSDPRCRWQNSD